MDGTFFSEIVLSVVHVLRGINLVELSLSISDLEEVVLRDILVLAEVSTNKRTVSLGSVHVSGDHECIGNSHEREDSPSDSHLLEVSHAGHELEGHVVGSTPGHSSDTVVGLPKSSQVPSILVRHVGGHKVFVTILVIENIEPFETVILNLVFLEPRSSRLLGNTAEVTHGAHFIQHDCLYY